MAALTHTPATAIKTGSNLTRTVFQATGIHYFHRIVQRHSQFQNYFWASLSHSLVLSLLQQWASFSPVFMFSIHTPQFSCSQVHGWKHFDPFFTLPLSFCCDWYVLTPGTNLSFKALELLAGKLMTCNLQNIWKAKDWQLHVTEELHCSQKSWHHCKRALTKGKNKTMAKFTANKSRGRCPQPCTHAHAPCWPRAAFRSWGWRPTRNREPQNGWGWKGSLEVIWSKPPAQAGPPTADCPGPCPDGFWISPKDGDYTTSLGSLCQCSVTFPVKKCFLMFRGNLLCFSLCPLPLVLSLGTTEKSLAPSSLHPPFRYLCTLIRSPWTSSSQG